MEIYFLLTLILSVFSVFAYYDPAIENVADLYNCNQYSNREQSKRKSDRQNSNNNEDFDNDNDAAQVDDEITSYDDFNANYQDGQQAYEDKNPVEDGATENQIQAKSLYKRESKDLNVPDPADLAEISSMSDAEIESVLSKLKLSDLQLLDKMIDNEEADSNKKKREIIRLKTEDERNSKLKSAKSDVQKAKLIGIGQGITSEEEYTNLPNGKRSIPQHRHLTDSERTESRIEAKINFLRDKYKRQSALQKLENSMKNRKEKRALDEARENPYYNRMLGPRVRAKRSNDDAIGNEKQGKSDEYIRALEESFPNPIAGDDIQSDEPHIRVKRSEN